MEWWGIFVSGLILVALVSIERFNEPTFKQTAQGLYRKFSPKDITSEKLYNRALFAYLAIALGFYSGLSFSSEFSLLVLGADKSVAKNPLNPFIAAAAVITLQSVWFIREIEVSLRSALHRWANIPEGVRRTVESLRRSDFNFALYRDSILSGADEFVHFDQYAVFDEEKIKAEPLMRRWLKICCILSAIRSVHEGPDGKLSVNDKIFEVYKDEYDSILRMHRALANAVFRYKQMESQEKYRHQLPGMRNAILSDLRTLREDLYQFLACAVRSRFPTESEIHVALNRIGFQLPKVDDGGMDPLSVVAPAGFAAAMSIVGAFLMDRSFDGLSDWKAYLAYLPNTDIEEFLWSFNTFFFYASAIVAALLYRSSVVAKDKWLKIVDGEAVKPVGRYIVGGIIGFCASYLTLIVIVLLETAAFIGYGENAAEVYRQTFERTVIENWIWGFLPALVAFVLLYFRDCDAGELTPARRLGYAVAQACAMGFLAFVFAGVFTQLHHQGRERLGLDTVVSSATAEAGQLGNGSDATAATTLIELRRPDGNPSTHSLTEAELEQIQTQYHTLVGLLVGMVGLFFGWYYPQERLRTLKRKQSWTGSWLVHGENGVAFQLDVRDGQIATANLPEHDQGIWKRASDKLYIAWPNGGTGVLFRDGRVVRYNETGPADGKQMNGNGDESQPCGPGQVPIWTGDCEPLPTA